MIVICFESMIVYFRYLYSDFIIFNTYSFEILINLINSRVIERKSDDSRLISIERRSEWYSSNKDSLYEKTWQRDKWSSVD
jgi:hypothetical protein